MCDVMALCPYSDWKQQEDNNYLIKGFNHESAEGISLEADEGVLS